MSFVFGKSFIFVSLKQAALEDQKGRGPDMSILIPDEWSPGVETVDRQGSLSSDLTQH
jgi:uncharacterized protein (DUF2237 family)